ncbi:MAG: hypothetical protein JNM00_01790 [Flavobacteriales bacterium]|nr:hypothetical protein [Flavobacteriales bacterium]
MASVKKDELQLQLIRWTLDAENTGNIQKVLQFAQGLESESLLPSKPMGYTAKGVSIDLGTLKRRYSASQSDLSNKSCYSLEQLQVRSDQW